MTMMHKINKLEKPGRPQGNFHALFGRSPTFYGHFRADVVTSEWSTRMSHHTNHFYTHSNIQKLLSVVNEKLDSINQWFFSNKLSLNAKKNVLFSIDPVK